MTDQPAPLTDEQHTAIRYRYDAVPDGDWHTEPCINPHTNECPCIIARTRPDGSTEYIADAETPELAHWIAHAREDVPALLAEVDRLRAELADARTAWRRLQTGLIANADLLDVPFSNAPDQSPWKRLKPSMRVLDDSLKNAAAVSAPTN